MPKLSVIIPAYNEEDKIKSGLEEIDKKLSGKDYEILVVDDGSTDNTAKIVRDTNIKKVNLIQLKKNKGKGAAVREGVMQSRGEYVLFTDADQSTPIDHIFEFLREIKSHDIVIGSRALPESAIVKKQPLVKRILGHLGSIIIRLILKLPYKDTQCGFKLFKSRVAKEIFNEISCLGWAFDFEVLKIADNRGLRVKEMPVVWKDNPDTKVNFKDYLIVLKKLFLIKKRYKKKGFKTRSGS